MSTYIFISIASLQTSMYGMLTFSILNSIASEVYNFFHQCKDPSMLPIKDFPVLLHSLYILKRREIDSNKKVTSHNNFKKATTFRSIYTQIPHVFQTHAPLMVGIPIFYLAFESVSVFSSQFSTTFSAITGWHPALLFILCYIIRVIPPRKDGSMCLSISDILLPG